MSKVVYYPGDIYAWIDSSTGSMYGADYVVTYNHASQYSANGNQAAYSEAWMPISKDLYLTSNVWLTDGWSVRYICNGVSGKTVEFDEIKLEI